MADVKDLSVTLTPELGEADHRPVASGDYATESEVVRGAQRKWKLRQAHCADSIEELRRLWTRRLGERAGREREGRIRPASGKTGLGPRVL